MSSREGGTQLSRRTPTASPWYLDEVEIDPASVDPRDFALFCASDHLAIEPRPVFRAALREYLRGFVRRLYPG